MADVIPAPTRQVVIKLAPKALPMEFWTSATCPKCHAAPGEWCRTPQGRKHYNPSHGARTALVLHLSEQAVLRSAAERLSRRDGV